MSLEQYREQGGNWQQPDGSEVPESAYPGLELENGSGYVEWGTNPTTGETEVTFSAQQLDVPVRGLDEEFEYFKKLYPPLQSIAEQSIPDDN